MKKGRSSALSFNAHTDLVVRRSGFILPIALFLYGLLIQTDAIRSSHLFVAPVLYLICIAGFILGTYQLIYSTSSNTNTALRLIGYHALAATYIWMVSGIAMPFIVCWIILFYASYLYFGQTGLTASMLAFCGVFLGDILINFGDVDYMIRASLFFAGTVVVGYVGGNLAADQDVDRKELSRIQAEELLQRDRVLTIINNMADAVFSTDRDGVIHLYNAACLNLLDTNSELTGKKIDSVISLIDSSNKRFRLSEHLHAARIVEAREDLSAVISGETIRLSVVYSPIRSTNSGTTPGADGYVLILRDITKQKSLEEERDEFISVISHELRTPITIAEGSLSNARVMMTRDDIPKSAAQESLAAAHDQVVYLARLVNDLSTLSRAERGIADAPEEVDVRSLIHDLYSEYAPQAEAKGLHFNLDMPSSAGTVMASPLYLKELLQNFVTNAIKYSKQGSVTVTVTRDSDTLHFSVKDTGIGISKSDQAHVFEKFWRSEDYRTRETGGTGLGLYVTRKLAKKLGVTIEMTSRLNHGSTFSFAMPAHDKPSASQ